MTTCPTCSTETHGRKCASSYCEGHADGFYDGEEAGKLAVIRALLERDAADVQHAFDDEDEDRRLSQWEADMCEAWLVRARAAL